MTKKPTVRQVIVVEGRYDKNTVLQIVNATVVETEGFGLFRDEKKRALLRRLAEKRGVIVLTDSDGAGFVIRNHLRGILPPEKVRHAYIPDVFGKERRKDAPSREGKLGVEGMDRETILNALRRAGAEFEDEASSPDVGTLTMADMAELGLSGPGSEARRARLKERLGLPERMSSKALFQTLRALYTRQELEAIVSEA